MATSPPTIFSPARHRTALLRSRALRSGGDAPSYVIDDMVEDVLERLAFLRHDPRKALVIGDWTGRLAAELLAAGCEVTALDPLDFDQEAPLPAAGFDLVASLGTLDAVNDLPGALLHLRAALEPAGLLLASFPGAGSLAQLRAIMLEADGDRPAGRIHPQIDVRAGGQLLQRCGYTDPVADSRPLKVRFSSLSTLVGDLRAQALGNVLARPGPALGKAALARARRAFADRADPDGKLAETFEILTLSGRRG